MNDVSKRDAATLDAAIAGLQRDLQPGRDLWPGIEHAINETRPRRTWAQYTALAASIVLIFAASLHFGQVEPTVLPGIDRSVLAGLQREHDSNKQALLVQYSDAPALYADWQEQMQQLEQAEQVIYNALREEPGNLELLRILRQVQEKQLQLIDRAFSPRRNTI